MSVNKEHMCLWIEALRSGKYTQGRELLTQISPQGVETNCCLGVACKVAIANGLSLAVQEFYDDSFRAAVVEYERKEDVLPAQVVEWLGLEPGDTNPTVFTEVNGLVLVAKLNDAEHWTFDQIADALEEMYL